MRRRSYAITHTIAANVLLSEHGLEVGFDDANKVDEWVRERASGSDCADDRFEIQITPLRPRRRTDRLLQRPRDYGHQLLQLRRPPTADWLRDRLFLSPAVAVAGIGTRSRGRG